VNNLTQARQPASEPDQQITALYQAHALGLAKLAYLMTGDQPMAEDIVQEAFLGLYRRWATLVDQDKALSYVRSCVLNACRQLHRVKHRQPKFHLDPLEDIKSAEEAAIIGEANRAVLAAIRRLPPRQREAVVLRYYLDMSEDQAAQAMGVSRGTVKSATSRGLAALARMLKETK
jgi:RNA polymerase sigma-70 factor (sigma-E family)